MPAISCWLPAEYTGPPPSGWSSDQDIHAIKLSSESEEQQACSCDLLFQHTATYPEEPPLLKLSNTRGMTNADIDKLTAVLLETADEHVGMASVFAIMQAAQDWLEAKVGLEQGEASLPAPAGAALCPTAPAAVMCTGQ